MCWVYTRYIRMTKIADAKDKLVKFKSSELKRIETASLKAGVSASEFIRIGAWMLSKQSADGVNTLRLKYLGKR
jgi:hypothetical protein